MIIVLAGATGCSTTASPSSNFNFGQSGVSEKSPNLDKKKLVVDRGYTLEVREITKDDLANVNDSAVKDDVGLPGVFLHMDAQKIGRVAIALLDSNDKKVRVEGNKDYHNTDNPTDVYYVIPLPKVESIPGQSMVVMCAFISANSDSVIDMRGFKVQLKDGKLVSTEASKDDVEKYNEILNTPDQSNFNGNV